MSNPVSNPADKYVLATIQMPIKIRPDGSYQTFNDAATVQFEWSGAPVAPLPDRALTRLTPLLTEFLAKAPPVDAPRKPLAASGQGLEGRATEGRSTLLVASATHGEPFAVVKQQTERAFSPPTEEQIMAMPSSNAPRVVSLATADIVTPASFHKRRGPTAGTSFKRHRLAARRFTVRKNE